MDFPLETYRQMLNTRHSAAASLGMKGMEPWPPRKAARLMAIVQVFGNNEAFTLSPKFTADREYIQQLYGIGGGEVPDEEFADHLRYYVEMYEAVKDEKDLDFTDANHWIQTMYNFKIMV